MTASFWTWEPVGMKAYILRLICAGILWPTLGAAELYKWTDDQGNFHITDTPPSFMQKQPSAVVKPAPQSMPPKKAVGRSVKPRRRAESHLAPVPTVATPSTREASVQLPQGGLGPNQATLTSPWNTFEETPVNAKAPVLHWKNEQGLDHFADVFPMIKGGAEVAVRSEHGAVSRAAVNARERATAVSRMPNQVAE